MSIRHVRYSTSHCKSGLECAQPLLSKTSFGEFAIAHNGHIPNLEKSKISKQFDYLTDSDFIKEYIKNIVNTLIGLIY